MKSKWIPIGGFYLVESLEPEKHLAVLKDPKNGKTLPSKVHYERIRLYKQVKKGKKRKLSV